MKALEKDRDRRYATPASFAEDVGPLPPAARRSWPGRRRRRIGSSRFARRHRGAVLAAAAVDADPARGDRGRDLAGVVATGPGGRRPPRQRSGGRQGREGGGDAGGARLRAGPHLRRGPAPGAGRRARQGRDPASRPWMAALPYVDGASPDQPLVEARLRGTLGNSFLYLGRGPDRGRPARAGPRHLHADSSAPTDPDTLQSANALAGSYRALGRLDEALKLHEETLARRRARLGRRRPGHAREP